MDRIRASVIEPVGGHGGLEFYDLGLCEALESQQIDTTLYTCKGLEIDRIYAHKCRVRFTYTNTFSHKNKILKGIKFFLGTIRSLADSIRRGASVSHFHIFHFAYREFFNILVFRIFGFKIIATIHDVEPLDRMAGQRNRKKYRKFSKIIDRIIVHNSFTKREVLNTGQGFMEEEIDIVPPTDFDFIYNENISKQRAAEELGLPFPDGARIILFFGQIKETKGLELLIKAFAGVKEENVFLLIAGRCWKTDMDIYRGLIRDLGVENKTEIIERYIEDRDVMRLFKAADVVVLPYLKVYNSSVLLRSMDYGAANIVSDLGFFTGIIEDGKNGLIFRKGDEKGLRSALLRILKDEQLLERIRKNAKVYIDENYSFEISGRKTKKVYMKALGTEPEH